MVMLRITLFSMLLLCGVLAEAASLQATVDRNPITENDSVRLTLTANNYDNDLNPDLTAVRELFDVLSTSQSNQMSYINGRMNSSKQLHIILAPKQAGSLVIPSIKVGQLQSDPIVLQVVAAGSQSQSGGVADITLEADVDTSTPYLQQQVILTVRLTHAVDLAEGTLPNPEVDGAEVYKLGDDKGFQTIQNGRRIGVIERRYALLPQQSGKITVPSILFRGQTQGRGGFGGLFNTPFNQGRQLQARSKPITLEVKPQPQGNSGIAWLPAKSLTLSEQWSTEPPVFRVGEPITRTLTLQATGLSANQLPELTLQSQNGIKLYPDQPQLESSATEEGIVGSRIEKVAIVPTQSGTITLPAITISWWNSDTRQMSLAKLPARTIQVLPATNESEVSTTPTSTTDKNLATPITNNLSQANIWPWQLATLLFALAWLFTLWLWWNKKNTPAAPVTATLHHKASLKDVHKACRNNQPKQARDALLAWGKSSLPQHTVRSLVDLANQIHQTQAQQALKELDAVIYKGEETWDGNAFWTAIEKPLKEYSQKNNSDPHSALAPLYQ